MQGRDDAGTAGLVIDVNQPWQLEQAQLYGTSAKWVWAWVRVIESAAKL